MRHLDLFSGIGGFALATEMVWDDVEHTFCDIEPFAQAVLSKHWPNAKIYGDIRTLTADAYRIDGEAGENEKEAERRDEQAQPLSIGRHQFDLLTGGFPCQPFSQAGARKGTEDSRHLWPEMLRVIREFHPRWIIGENVGGLVTWSEGLVLEQIHTDLEGEGYEVQAFIIPAVSLNAPHRRDRVWIVAHATGERKRGGSDEVYGEDGRQDSTGVRNSKQSDTDTPHTKRSGYSGKKHKAGSGAGHRGGAQQQGWDENWTKVATRLCRVDDGVPRRLDRNPRLKALGNAIVPQVAAEIMRAIKETDLVKLK